MSYGIHEDDKRIYKLSDKIIVINEKAHNERTHVVMFKNTKYTDDYFINKIRRWKDYYDLFGQDEEEEPWLPGPFWDSNLRRY